MVNLAQACLRYQLVIEQFFTVGLLVCASNKALHKLC